MTAVISPRTLSTRLNFTWEIENRWNDSSDRKLFAAARRACGALSRE